LTGIPTAALPSGIEPVGSIPGRDVCVVIGADLYNWLDTLLRSGQAQTDGRIAAQVAARQHDRGRKVTMYVLRTTPGQDKKMLAYLQKHPDGGVKRDAFGADLMFSRIARRQFATP
jgi:hypothetical protein